MDVGYEFVALKGENTREGIGVTAIRVGIECEAETLKILLGAKGQARPVTGARKP